LRGSKPGPSAAAVIIGTLDFNLGTSLLVTDTTVGAEPEVLGAISMTPAAGLGMSSTLGAAGLAAGQPKVKARQNLSRKNVAGGAGAKRSGPAAKAAAMMEGVRQRIVRVAVAAVVIALLLLRYRWR
jgi:hypothetical protein